MALTSDKKYLFTAGEDKTIYVCYLENMKVLCKIDCNFKIRNLILSFDNCFLLAMS